MMTPARADAITRERLDGWAKKLNAEIATPFLLIGISHKAGENFGQPVLVVTEEAKADDLIRMLEGVAKLLKGQR
jgi:hypothetical protein